MSTCVSTWEVDYVDIYRKGEALEVEFITAKGKTVAVLTLTPSDIRPMERLEARKASIRNKYGITEQEENEYLLPNEEDYKILSKVKILESKDLSDNDKEIVELIKTQLKADWRTPLLNRLEQLLQKYS